jgi:hypothetical protein
MSANIRKIAKSLTHEWKPQPPVEGFGLIDEMEHASGVRLPADLKWFYQFVGNGGEGKLKRGYLWIHGVNDLIGLQERYAIQQWLPFCLMFAQDGDDGFGFDLRRGRDGSNYPVIQFSLSSRDESEVEEIAQTFAQFLERWTTA